MGLSARKIGLKAVQTRKTSAIFSKSRPANLASPPRPLCRPPLLVKRMITRVREKYLAGKTQPRSLRQSYFHINRMRGFAHDPQSSPEKRFCPIPGGPPPGPFPSSLLDSRGGKFALLPTPMWGVGGVLQDPNPEKYQKFPRKFR